MFWFFCSGVAVGIGIALPMKAFLGMRNVTETIGTFSAIFVCIFMFIGWVTPNVRSRRLETLVGTAYAVKIGKSVVFLEKNGEKDIDAFKIDASNVDDEGLLKIPDAVKCKLGISYEEKLTVN